MKGESYDIMYNIGIINNNNYNNDLTKNLLEYDDRKI